MLLRIHPRNPSVREINKVVQCLRDGGVVICPTDTVYGFTCDITKPKAVERVARIKEIDVDKANFSFVCYDLSHISDYTKPLDNAVFKLMRKALPGPFTFILEANNKVPHLFKSKKKTVGIRVPDNEIPREIVNLLGNPILSTSVYDENEIIEYSTDPELIHEKYSNLVDIVIDGGAGNVIPSTVVDCSSGEPIILRQGMGILADIL